MATTTADAIRDRALTVIEALTPDSLSETKYIRYRNEGDGKFEPWADANPVAAFRRVQVRTRGTDETPESSNHDVETHFLELEVRVAYPMTHRYGPDNALDRDDVIEQDRHRIETAIGLRGAANFAGSYPDATWRGGECSREPGVACDFLVIRQRMSYARTMT